MLFILEEFSDCLEIWKFLTETGSNVRLTLKSVYATIVLTQYSDNYYYLVKQHLPVEEMFICEKR
jgi:hypothetical protein